MFCKNCGNKLAEDALFCSNCGARQDQAGPAQPGPHSPPAAPLPPTQQGPGAYYQTSGQYTPPSNPTGAPSGQNGRYAPPPNTGGRPSGQYAPPPGPYAPPPKNNTTKILIISLAGLCVVIAAVLILVLKPFSSHGENTMASTSDAPVIGVEDNLNVVEPDNDTPVFDDTDGLDDTEDSFNSYDFGSDGDNAAGSSAAPSAPAGSLPPSAAPGSSTQELTMFNVPAWSRDPIYTVIDPGGVWTSVGLATNPNQVSGADGVFTLADYEGCVYYAEFFADLTWKIKFDEAGDIGVESAYYEIMDFNYADIYEYDDSYGFRFYNGSDGRLYMCFYLIDDDLYPDASDFVVFEKKGDTVDWAAE